MALSLIFLYCSCCNKISIIFRHVRQRCLQFLIFVLTFRAIVTTSQLWLVTLLLRKSVGLTAEHIVACRVLGAEVFMLKLIGISRQYGICQVLVIKYRYYFATQYFFTLFLCLQLPFCHFLCFSYLSILFKFFLLVYYTIFPSCVLPVLPTFLFSKIGTSTPLYNIFACSPAQS